MAVRRLPARASGLRTGRGAKDVLNGLSIIVDERRVLLGQAAHRQFSHSRMVCEILASRLAHPGSEPKAQPGAPSHWPYRRSQLWKQHITM